MHRKWTRSNKIYLVMLGLTAHRVVVVPPELNCKSFSMNPCQHHCNMGEDGHVFILLRFGFGILQLVHSWLAHIGACENIEDVWWWRKRQQNGKKISDHSQYCPGQGEQRLRKWVATEKMHCWNILGNMKYVSLEQQRKIVKWKASWYYTPTVSPRAPDCVAERPVDRRIRGGPRW